MEEDTNNNNNFNIGIEINLINRCNIVNMNIEQFS